MHASGYLQIFLRTAAGNSVACAGPQAYPMDAERSFKAFFAFASCMKRLQGVSR